MSNWFISKFGKRNLFPRFFCQDLQLHWKLMDLYWISISRMEERKRDFEKWCCWCWYSYETYEKFKSSKVAIQELDWVVVVEVVGNSPSLLRKNSPWEVLPNFQMFTILHFHSIQNIYHFWPVLHLLVHLGHLDS